MLRLVGPKSLERRVILVALCVNEGETCCDLVPDGADPVGESNETARPSGGPIKCRAWYRSGR